MTRKIGSLIHVYNPIPVTDQPAKPRLFRLRRSMRGAGNFRVYGNVTVEGLPASRRVALLDRDNLTPLQVVWSGADGSYEFLYVSEAEKIVLGLDYQRVYNAVVADAVTPEPMP